MIRNNEIIIINSTRTIYNKCFNNNKLLSTIEYINNI